MTPRTTARPECGKKENGPACGPLPQNVTSRSALALLLDLRELAHLLGSAAELDGIAALGETALGDGHALAAEAEEPAGLELDRLHRAIGSGGDGVHRPDLASIGGEYRHADQRIGL